MGGGDDDAVSESRFFAPIVGEDSMGNCRGGGVLGIAFFPSDVNIYPMSGKDFQGCFLGGGGESAYKCRFLKKSVTRHGVAVN